MNEVQEICLRFSANTKSTFSCVSYFVLHTRQMNKTAESKRKSNDEVKHEPLKSLKTNN